MENFSGQPVDFAHEALEHIDALFGYAMMLTRSQADAEDLVQETYLRAVRAAKQLTPDSNLKGWLFVIMRNAWLNQLRHTQTGPRFVELEVDDQSLPLTTDERSSNPHVVYIRKLEREQVREAIETLPDSYREIIVLRDLEGFSYQDIAGLLECPAGTVMSRLARARGKLRESLSGWYSRRRIKAI
jgi:RNA polymerase sigma-70 factor, ECF subfamily